MKKIISILLSVIMIFTMFSTVAFADDGKKTITIDGKTYDKTDDKDVFEEE